MHPVLTELGLLGIVPVIAIEDAAHAEPLAEALIAGGLPCAEITFRTGAAREAMQRIAAKAPSMVMGAGTVLSVERVKEAVDAGARFIVAPGLNRSVVEYCLSQGIPVTPGVATPTEIEEALSLGLGVVKFFPAETHGGVEYLRAISAPYKTIKFIPTGGIDAGNLLSYLKLPAVHACGGSWMVKSDLIARGGFDTIRTLTEQAVGLMLGFHLAHVGIQGTTAEEASLSAGRLSTLLGLPVREGSSSFFVGSQVEMTKRPFPGTHGHIAVGTNFIERAVYVLGRKGVRFREGSYVEKNGKLVAVYMEEEIAGFGLHLLQV
jgi:2-dehydro-3-deoxyphosphogluconate aldolase/(4S)-4-hydroxy-2-oxoglutarate aldolase